MPNRQQARVCKLLARIYMNMFFSKSSHTIATVQKSHTMTGWRTEKTNLIVAIIPIITLKHFHW